MQLRLLLLKVFSPVAPRYVLASIRRSSHRLIIMCVRNSKMFLLSLSEIRNFTCEAEEQKSEVKYYLAQ